MNRRLAISLAGLALCASVPLAAVQAQPIKIGAVAPKTGPLAE